MNGIKIIFARHINTNLFKTNKKVFLTKNIQILIKMRENITKYYSIKC